MTQVDQNLARLILKHPNVEVKVYVELQDIVIDDYNKQGIGFLRKAVFAEIYEVDEKLLVKEDADFDEVLGVLERLGLLTELQRASDEDLLKAIPWREAILVYVY